MKGQTGFMMFVFCIVSAISFLVARLSDDTEGMCINMIFVYIIIGIIQLIKFIILNNVS